MPPSLDDAAKFTEYVSRHNAILMTTKLVDACYIAAFLVFVSGFRRLLRRALPDAEWIADLVFGAGLVHAAVVLVGDVLAGAAAMDTVNNPDPTAVRALTEASLFAFGGIGFVMTALFFAATSYAFFRAGSVRLLGWVASVLAVLNLVAVPAIYQGNDFMAILIAGGNSIWLVILGIAIVRNRTLG
jgi:hypothetical protein